MQMFKSITRNFHTSYPAYEIRKLTRMRVVDNSVLGKQAMAEGKPPKCIHVYNRQHIGRLGDVILLAIKGEMKKGIIVGTVQFTPRNVPRFDSNNVVLIDHSGTPLGTRIHVPIPYQLRTILKAKTFSKGADYTKLLAISTRFV